MNQIQKNLTMSALLLPNRGLMAILLPSNTLAWRKHRGPGKMKCHTRIHTAPWRRSATRAITSALSQIRMSDRLDNDMIPAKALGMKTVWIRNSLARYQMATLGDGFADHQINRLSELLLLSVIFPQKRVP